MSKSAQAKEAGQSGIAAKVLAALPYDRVNAIPLQKVGQEVVKAGFHHPDLKVIQGCLSSLRKDHLIGLAKGPQNIALFYRHATKWATETPAPNGNGKDHAEPEHRTRTPPRTLVQMGEVYKRMGISLRHSDPPLVVTDELRTTQPAPEPQQGPQQPAPEPVARLNEQPAPDLFFDIAAKLDELMNLHLTAATLADEIKRNVQANGAEQIVARMRALLGCKP